MAVLRVRSNEAGRPTPAERQEGAPDVQIDFVGSLSNAAKIIRLLHEGEKRLVFCDSRSRVEELALLLREQKVETFISHSSLGVEERRLAEQAFAQRQNCVIVATSSLELGIDVGDLDRVIQIDAPATVSSFLQRMGRTGRRSDNPSNCLFLATSDEALLRAAALVRLWNQGFVEPVNAPPKPYHILAQQLMALCLQERGIGRSEWFDWLESVPAFREMDQTVRPVARGFDDRQPDPLERPGHPLLRPRGRGKVRSQELHGTSVRLHITAAFPCHVRAEGARVRSRIDLLQPEQQAVSPAARRSILEDDPSGLAASNRPRRAIGPEGEVTMAGSGAVPQLRGLSIHPGDSGKRQSRSRTGPGVAPADWLNCVRNSPGSASDSTALVRAFGC